MVKRSKEKHPAGPKNGPHASAPGAEPRPTARAGPLDGAVRDAFAVSWGTARGWIQTGKVSVNGGVETDPLARVVVGDSLAVHLAARRRDRAPALGDERIVFVDAHV